MDGIAGCPGYNPDPRVLDTYTGYTKTDDNGWYSFALKDPIGANVSVWIWRWGTTPKYKRGYRQAVAYDGGGTTYVPATATIWMQDLTLEEDNSA